MPDEWAWILGDITGQPLPGAHLARGRRLVYTRNHADEARLTLSLHDQGCIELFNALRNGIPTLNVLRNGDEVFAGHWNPMSGGNAVDENSHVELVFRSAFGNLDYRYTDTTITYAAWDAGAIAFDLINNTDLDSATGIDPAGVIEATKDRDRTYENKQISEAIIELTEVLEGFDWYPGYLNPQTNGGRTMTFNVAASYGSDQEAAIFEFGAGTLENVRAYSFTAGLPVNRVRAIGAQSGGAALTSDQQDDVSIDQFNMYMQLVSLTDVSEQASLDDRARDALRGAPVFVTQFTADPALAPKPWDDFWIGDTIRWNLDDGAMQEQEQPRVQTIEIGLDEDDNTTDLVIGIDPAATASFQPPANSTRAYVQGQRELLRRLSALER